MLHRDVNVAEGAFQRQARVDRVGARGVKHLVDRADGLMHRMHQRQPCLRNRLIRWRFPRTQGAPEPPDGVENKSAGGVDDGVGLGDAGLHQRPVPQQIGRHGGGFGGGDLGEAVDRPARDAQRIRSRGCPRWTYQARRLYKAPVWFGGSSDRQLRRDGTTTSSTVKSWLPVPRIPITDQVSTMVTDSLGTHSARRSGIPAAERRGVSPSIMMQVQYNQRAFWIPLAKFQRPLTR